MMRFHQIRHKILENKKYKYEIKSVPGTLEIPFLLNNYSGK